MPVYRTKSGIYRIQFMLNGKNYIKSSKTENKKAAELMEAKWKTQLHAQRYLGEREPIKVQTLIDNYLQLPLAATTLKNARAFFNLFTKEVDCNVNAHEFKQTEIEKFVQTRLKDGIAQATLHTQLLYFSGAWNDGNKEIYEIPALKLPKLKRSPMKTEYLTLHQEAQLFDYLRNRLDKGSGAGERKGEVEDVFSVLIDTGLRHNELSRLEWNKIDLGRRVIEVWRNKTEHASTIPMTNRVHEVLQRRFANKMHQQWVFTNQANDNHRNDNTTYLNEVLFKAGIPLTVHQMRHTYISRLLQNGMTAAEVQKLSGHRSLASLSRYIHLEQTTVNNRAVDILNSQNVEMRRKAIKVV